MTSDEMNELFYGKDIADKAKLFKEELNKVEENNFEYFKSQRSKFASEEHDKLGNHYMIYTANSRVTFNFLPDSKLLQSIKDECIEAFKRVYTGAKQKPTY
jgi:hypothetical protein